jgi:serine/threonine protein phosphatase 1
MGIFHSLFGPKPRKIEAFETQLSIPSSPAAMYAIGDVHGCLDLLTHLERTIVDDSASIGGDKLLVMLGDYVDRGPNSSGVIDHLLRPAPAGFTRIHLAGNHEEFLLKAIAGAGDEAWLEYGGAETLVSYGIDVGQYRSANHRIRQKILESMIPQDHVKFLTNLAVSLQVQNTIFVHAGIRRGLPIEQQDRNDLMWIRGEFLDAPAADGLLVIHGHTPVDMPEIAAGRIGIDTGAFATGRLTAVRLMPNQTPAFFTTSM